MANLIPGAVFGPFRLIEMLGRGGMASVWKAHETHLDRFVALKVLPAEFLHDEHFSARFQREARLVAKLEHPRIVPIFAFGIESGVPWMSTRLIPGGNLATLLARGPLERKRAIEIARAVADALAYAHGLGVVHRDVKPQNILVDAAGAVYLADFGIARMVEGEASITRTGLVSGTPQYMAPEYAKGAGLDQRVDVYALGIVVYEMLTGAAPFSADTPVAVLFKQVSEPIPVPSPQAVPEPLLGPLLKSLAKDPKDRWQSADEFVSALERGMATLARSAPHPPADSSMDPTVALPAWSGSARGRGLSPESPGSATEESAGRADASRSTVPIGEAPATDGAHRSRKGMAGWQVGALVAGALALVALGYLAWPRSEPDAESWRSARSTVPPVEGARGGATDDGKGSAAVEARASDPQRVGSPAASAGSVSITGGERSPSTPREDGEGEADGLPDSGASASPASPVETTARGGSAGADAPGPAGVESGAAAAEPRPPAGPAFRLGERIVLRGVAAGPVTVRAARFSTTRQGALEVSLEIACAPGKDQVLTYEVVLFDAQGAAVAKFAGEKDLDEGDDVTVKRKQNVPARTVAAVRSFRVRVTSVAD